MSLEMEAVVTAARHYRICKSEQAIRAARGSEMGQTCLHVVWNGGPQLLSCVALLFQALDELELVEVTA